MDEIVIKINKDTLTGGEYGYLIMVINDMNTLGLISNYEEVMKSINL